MTPTSTTLTRPAPVTIGLRPPTEATGTLPITPPPVPEGTFQIIADLNIDVAESAGCCSAGDDQPYQTGRAAPAVRWPGRGRRNRHQGLPWFPGAGLPTVPGRVSDRIVQGTAQVDQGALRPGHAAGAAGGVLVVPTC